MSESQEQQALIQWAEILSGQYPELKLMYHIPNEGKRSPMTGARMKCEGLKKGVPDLCLPVARKGYHGLYIEMKAKGGKVTVEQGEWLKALGNQGYLTLVGWDWVKTAEEIKKYLEEK